MGEVATGMHPREGMEAFLFGGGLSLGRKRCPPHSGLGNMNRKPLGHYCWTNGTNVRLWNPANGDINAKNMLRTSVEYFIAGIGIGFLPFLMGLALLVCAIPCRSEVE